MTDIMKEIDFEKGGGLVPAVIQDVETRAVLMLGYMDPEALQATQTTGRVTFYSRSKGRHWTKGETSGNYLEYIDMKVDCDGDTLLVQARPQGPVCHTGTDTCWGEQNREGIEFLSALQQLIAGRKREAAASSEVSGSYVGSLFREGIPKIAQKVGEEAVETVIEAMDSNQERFLNESADLLFHLLVLLQAKGFALEEVVAVLRERHRNRR